MAAVCTVMYMKEAMEWADKNGGVTGVKIRDGNVPERPIGVPKGTEGVCVPSTWTTSDHRPTTTVELYRAVVKGPTDGPLADLVKSGTIALDKVAIPFNCPARANFRAGERVPGPLFPKRGPRRPSPARGRGLFFRQHFRTPLPACGRGGSENAAENRGDLRKQC